MESGQIVADADKTASPDAIVELELSEVELKKLRLHQSVLRQLTMSAELLQKAVQSI